MWDSSLPSHVFASHLLEQEAGAEKGQSGCSDANSKHLQASVHLAGPGSKAALCQALQQPLLRAQPTHPSCFPQLFFFF